MKHKYCGISIGDDIKDIINKFDITKIKYEKIIERLYFKLGKFSKKNKFRMFFLYSYKNRKSCVYYNF